jgi:hypothetical protein
MVQILEMSRIASTFAGAGIPWLSLKGPALAVQTTGIVDARGGGDIDVLVPPHSVGDVFRILTALGWVIRSPSPGEPTSWAWQHVLRTYNEMTFDGPHSSIDVHWRLDPTQSALPDFASAWARRVTVDVRGMSMQTLCAADAFSHTCHHAAKDEWRSLRSLVDVHRLARDPSVWAAKGLRQLDRTTLAVTEACVGLPDGLPQFVLDEVHGASGRATRRAIAAQNRPANAETAFPGAHTLRGVAYRFSASRSPADLRIALVAAALPADSVADLSAPSVWSALPRLVVRRISRLLGKSAAWCVHRPGNRAAQVGPES